MDDKQVIRGEMTIFETFQAGNQDYNPMCRGCKQPYKDHIDLDGKKICRWPADYPKPVQSDQDYIRKAAKLADGWSISHDDYYFGPDIVGSHVSRIGQSAKDTLAAQLVRQVDALDDIRCDIDSRYCEVWGEGQQTLGKCISDDRTMSTIKAIVDSEVLEQ